ncbi:MAG: hypothetical protein AB7G11_12305 [Phycisphaerales bacterium]
MTHVNRRAGITARISAGCALLMLAAGAAAQPANNNCANAIPIGNTTIAGTTVAATNDFAGTCGASTTSPDVWYLYTAPATNTINVTVCGGASFDTVLSVHNAPCANRSVITCLDDSCGLQTMVSFSAVSGVQYLIRVSGFSGASGPFTMSVGPGSGGVPPANDTCASAEPIGNGTFNGTNTNAMADGEGSCLTASAPDVYYRYTAPATGVVTASTCSSANFDTAISIHSGCPATIANEMACNDNFCVARSQVSFTAQAGVQYIIRVGGNTGTGIFTLTMGDPPPPGPNGPDVTHQGMTTSPVFNAGAVGGIRGYALGSETCNIGDADLTWANAGTPALGMNAYRLHNGRLLQIGMGYSKTACCAAAGSGCGSCNGHGGSVLGAGCKDVYGAGYNAGQGHLAPRSAINGYTGVISSFPQVSGDAIFRRLQVPQSDMLNVNFPSALYFVEGAYIATDDAASGNAYNNNSYLRVTVNQSTFDMAAAGSTNQTIPAIRAWRDHGGGAGIADPSVNVFTVDVPMEGRFWVATKVTDQGNGSWLYDYAIYNMNSDRSGGSFSIPLGGGVNASAVGFHDVNYHSGDPYDNTDWISGVGPSAVEWRSPQTFAQNANSNALRWGTMYNFWFSANTPPTTGQATLGLFKPGTPTAISFDVPVPTGGCAGDWNHDGSVTSQDFFDFVADFFNGNADFNNDGASNSQDFFDFIAAFFTPC